MVEEKKGITIRKEEVRTRLKQGKGGGRLSVVGEEDSWRKQTRKGGKGGGEEDEGGGKARDRMRGGE